MSPRGQSAPWGLLLWGLLCDVGFINAYLSFSFFFPQLVQIIGHPLTKRRKAGAFFRHDEKGVLLVGSSLPPTAPRVCSISTSVLKHCVVRALPRSHSCRAPTSPTVCISFPRLLWHLMGTSSYASLAVPGTRLPRVGGSRGGGVNGTLMYCGCQTLSHLCPPK